MSLRDDLLADIDDIRGIPGDLGTHRFQVWVRVTTSSGSRPGKGADTVTETRLLVGGQDPHVREVQSKDAVGGAPDLAGLTVEVGPLTPGATSIDTINPPRSGDTAATTLYLLRGPGLPAEGALFQRVEDGTTKPFRYMVTLRAIGRLRPA